jgi:hypothetical protein
MGLYDFTKDIATNPNAGVSSGTGFDKQPLPIGDYDFVVTESKERGYVAGLKGEGSMKPENVAAYLHEHPEIEVGTKLQVTAQITGGEFAGRKEWFTFLIQPSSDQTTGTTKYKSVDQMVKMEQGKFMGLLRRCNIQAINDANDLLGATFRVHAILSNDAKRNFWNLELKPDEVVQRPGTAVGTAPVKTEEPPF